MVKLLPAPVKRWPTRTRWRVLARRDASLRVTADDHVNVGDSEIAGIALGASLRLSTALAKPVGKVYLGGVASASQLLAKPIGALDIASENHSAIALAKPVGGCRITGGNHSAIALSPAEGETSVSGVERVMQPWEIDSANLIDHWHTDTGVVHSSGAITSWTGRNGNVWAQATTNRKPTWSATGWSATASGIAFSVSPGGQEDALTCATLAATGGKYTIAVVYSSTTTATNNVVLVDFNQQLIFYHEGTVHTAGLGLFDGTHRGFGNSTSTTAKQALLFYTDTAGATRGRAYRANTLVGEVSPYTSVNITGTTGLMANKNSNGQWCNGVVRSVTMWNHILSAGPRLLWSEWGALEVAA